ncbi:MAG: EMC3/TMCO1 family protein [Candidatus Woesearchaeota archaeon]|nr:EMC3/TMCO1 family protein [Candidatus Woesearchaeota archaeon]
MVFEALGTMVGSILDPVLLPLLKLGPFWALFIISLVISALTTLVYKLVTNQERMREIREKTKALQKEIKETSKKDPAKAMELQKKLFAMSKEQMMGSFKPMFITLLPLLIIFGWLNTNLGYEPLQPNQEFTTIVTFEKNVNGNVSIEAPQLDILDDKTQSAHDDTAQWRLKGLTGTYDAQYTFMGKTYTHTFIIKDQGKKGYLQPVKRVSDGLIKTISVDLQKIEVMNIFGWKLGWLGVYIMFSLIFSMSLRKVMNVY